MKDNSLGSASDGENRGSCLFSVRRDGNCRRRGGRDGVIGRRTLRRGLAGPWATNLALELDDGRFVSPSNGDPLLAKCGEFSRHDQPRTLLSQQSYHLSLGETRLVHEVHIFLFALCGRSVRTLPYSRGDSKGPVVQHGPCIDGAIVPKPCYSYLLAASLLSAEIGRNGIKSTFILGCWMVTGSPLMDYRTCSSQSSSLP